MEKGSFELPPLKATKRPRRKAWTWTILLGLILLVVAGAVIILLGENRTADPQSQQVTPTPIPCAPTPENPGTYIPDPDQPSLQPKSTDPADYVHDPEAPLAVVCGPASIFPPGSGVGIVFADAVYTHCELQPAGPDALCRLAYASGPNLLPEQPENPSATIEGRNYGNCRFEGPLEALRMPGAGRDDQVSYTLRCFLLPVN